MANLPTKLGKAISDKFQVQGNTLIREVKPNSKDRIQVEIGDSKQPDFKPQFKFMRWDNEVNFSLRAEEDPTAKVEFDGEKTKYIAKDYEVHLYDKPEASEDGGFEFEWVLPKKPASNVLKTTIQTKGLDFFKQLPLTQSEIDEGMDRPENVVNSYAVYHQTKGGMNKAGGMEYKVGKAFHIYRPKVVDANGSETWGELNIDEQKGELTVTVDQTYLDNAVYPVVVDPTFGYTSIGGSTTQIANTTGSVCVRNGMGPVNPQESGTITQISAAIRNLGSGTETLDVTTFINTENEATDSHAEVANSEVTGITTSTTPTFYNFPYAGEAISNVNYVLNIVGDIADIVTNSVSIAFDNAGSRRRYNEDFATYAAAMEDPWTETDSTSAVNLSIYAIYTATSVTDVTAQIVQTFGSNADATSYNTRSIVPEANVFYLLWVYTIAAEAPNTPTVSGAGMTWVAIDNQIDSASLRKITCFRAMHASPSAGALTIDFAGQTQTGCAWSLVRYYHTDTSGTNGSGAIVQSAKNASAGNATSLTVTLAAFASADNATAGGFGIPLNTAGQPNEGTGFTDTGQINQSTPNLSIGSEFRNDNDTSVDMDSGAASIPWVGIAVEIKFAAAGVTHPPFTLTMMGVGS